MLEEVKTQSELAQLYAQAQRLNQAQHWRAVANVMARIESIDPDYGDPDDLLATAEREIATLERENEDRQERGPSPSPPRQRSDARHPPVHHRSTLATSGDDDR